MGFAIFYMVINIGSLFGRNFGYLIRTRFGLSYIFAVAMCCAVIAFLVVLLIYRDPPLIIDPTKPRRTMGSILLDMVRVLKSPRFTLFLLVSSGFNFLYSQVYNVLPLYTKQVIETKPAMDLYTMANPLTIVLFQLPITKLFGKIKPIRSIVLGTVIISLSMVINLIPLYSAGGVREASLFGLPLGSIFITMTVVLVAFGELFSMARTYEYIGAMTPKGQEGLFLGYVNLPLAIGSLIGGPLGAVIFNDVMCKGATTITEGPLKGLFELQPQAAANGWLILMGIGLASAAGMWLYNVWLDRQTKLGAW